jgi:ABC-type sugar transport system permease subunit
MQDISKKWRETLTAYLFLSPFLIVFFVFLGYPVFYSFWLSFRNSTIYIDWYHVFSEMEYCGLDNYVTLLSDKSFWWSLLMTFYYGILTIPTSIALSLALALLLNNQLRGRNFFRAAFFLPNVLDLLVIGIVWILIFSPKYGLLDVALNKIGIQYFSDHNISILGSPLTCLPAIAMVMVLKGAGFGMILFLAAIQNIPASVYEAAEIDGATSWQKFRYITIPLVKPIILFMIITGTIGCLTAFTEVYAMTINTGGPTVQAWGESLKSANLAGYYLYRNFVDGFYGKAAAISFVLLFIALGISLAHMKLLKSE